MLEPRQVKKHAARGNTLAGESGHPGWRAYFRGTAAHRTARVDGFDQSTAAGRFLWTSKANVQVMEWFDSEDIARIQAQHDGYLRLADPVLHQRATTLKKGSRIIFC